MSIQSLDTDNLKASINQMILANERSVGGEVDEEREDPLTMVMRQLKVAMKRLEEEMLVTNREIDAMEEELEARYMLLEEEAEELDEEEYDRAMDFLDTESSNMETDKLRISELFGIRLKSIKDQYEEAKIRIAATKIEEEKKRENKERKFTTSTPMRSRFDAVADDQSHVSDSSTIKTTDSANLDAKNNKMSLPSSAKKTMSEEQKKKLEKGWTLHSRKNYSYNMKIQENIVRSSSKLKDSWTTDHTKKRLKRSITRRHWLLLKR